MFASNQSKEDCRWKLGRRGRVESNLKQGKARRAIEEGDAFNDNADDEIQSYFFSAATGMEVMEERGRSSATVLKKKSPSLINSISHHKSWPYRAKFQRERVVIIYDTTEKNN